MKKGSPGTRKQGCFNVLHNIATADKRHCCGIISLQFLKELLQAMGNPIHLFIWPDNLCSPFAQIHTVGTRDIPLSLWFKGDSFWGKETVSRDHSQLWSATSAVVSAWGIIRVAHPSLINATLSNSHPKAHLGKYNLTDMLWKKTEPFKSNRPRKVFRHPKHHRCHRSWLDYLLSGSHVG